MWTPKTLLLLVLTTVRFSFVTANSLGGDDSSTVKKNCSAAASVTFSVWVTKPALTTTAVNSTPGH